MSGKIPEVGVRSCGALFGTAIVFALVLATPGIALASPFPISISDLAGSPLEFNGHTFTLSDCTGAHKNNCTLGGDPSDEVNLSWSARGPLAFTLESDGAISAPAGTKIKFAIGDGRDESVSGNLVWVSWSQASGNTILDAELTNVKLYGPSGRLNTSQKDYYLQAVTNCGKLNCVTFNTDPPGSVSDLGLSDKPFPSFVATPEPPLAGLLAGGLAAMAGLALLRRFRMKRMKA